MAKYEYYAKKMLYKGTPDDLDQDIDTLNHLGLEGWELVTILTPPIASDPGSESLLYYFRRQQQHPE